MSSGSFNKRTYFVTILILLLILVLGNIFIFSIRFESVTKEMRHDLKQDISEFKVNIEGIVDQLSVVSGLYSNVKSLDHILFDGVGELLTDAFPDYRAIQLKDRNTKTIKVYPLEGNEMTLGRSLLDRSNVRESTLAAIQSKKITINKPFELIQGGIGSAIRSPIFFDDEFAGILVGVISFEESTVHFHNSFHEKGVGFKFYFGDEIYVNHSNNYNMNLEIRDSIIILNELWTFQLDVPITYYLFDFGLLINVLLYNGILWALAYNLTTRKKYDKKRRMILESKIKSRTKKIVSVNSELQDSNTKLGEALVEKDVLIKEIHHRVKNNMQIIVSILDLQATGLKSKKQVEVFKEIRNRVKSMSLIHEDLYKSQDFVHINFKNYITNLVNMLIRTYRDTNANIVLDLDVEDVSIDLNKAIPCGLILNELISNSLKYAFKGRTSGKLTISLRKNGKYELTVKDNGAGFPSNIDFKNTTSLGLRLVNILTNQIDGEISLNSSNGSEFKIMF